MNREGSLRVEETNHTAATAGCRIRRMPRKFAAYPPDKASTLGQEWGLSLKKQEKDVRYIRKPRSGGAFGEGEVVDMDVDVDMYVWGKQSSVEIYPSHCWLLYHALGCSRRNFSVNVPGHVEVGSDCGVGIEF